MSTASISALPISTELDTLVVVDMGVTDSDGNPTYKAVSEKEAEKLTTDKEATEVFRQSGKFYSATSDSGMVELIPEEDERVKMFNRGISVKQQNRFRTMLLERDDDGNLVFEAQESAIDLREIVAQPTQSRGLSDTEKALRAIGKLTLSAEDRAKVIAALQSAQG